MNISGDTLPGLIGLFLLLLTLVLLAAWARQRRHTPSAALPQPRRNIGTAHDEAVVAQEYGTAARHVAVGGDFKGDVNLTIVAPDDLWRVLGKRQVTADLREATRRYLEVLVDLHQYLSFKGMGVSDRVPLRLPLLGMYIPLRARIELPEGETWARDVRLAGRPPTEEELAAMGERLSAPQPVLELLQRHDGLVLLGDPGAGKTTFLKYLALEMALGGGAELGIGQRLPILLPLAAYAEALANGGEGPLGRFIERYYEQRLDELPLGAMLGEALAQGGALILLDGLDEVKEQGQRARVVERVVEFYAFHRRKGNKFVLTSRVVGYPEVRPSAPGLAEATLVDFDDEEIEAFVNKWTAALERAASGNTALAAREAEREREELLVAVRHNPGVRTLAANPLLLTILALMKRQGITLPERRVQLYQQYVETLLRHWNLARSQVRGLDVVETLRILAPLALWMHEVAPGRGLVKHEALHRQLQAIFAGRGEPQPEAAARQFLSDVREHAALLLDRGARHYGFIHLTFGEYLAAVALAQQGQQSVAPIVAALVAHIADDSWHEVSLLTIGYLGLVQQRDEAASAVLLDLLEQAPGAPGQAAVLAGEALADVWPGGVTLACKETIIQALLTTMRGNPQVAPKTRAAAGDILARCGDPRPEVLTLDEMQFCYIPPGPFWMGSDEDPEEQPAHLNDCLNYGYWLARYPVTVAQFRDFVAQSGYQPGYMVSLDRRATHPVVWVEWQEVLAFCAWLTRRWQAADFLLPGWSVHPPSEAEWEKGARGGLEIPCPPAAPAPVKTAPFAAPPALTLVANLLPRRRFPWGDVPDLTRTNSEESDIGTTSPVGCFPAGASPYGVEELSGNVWEWSRSRWGPDYGKTKFPYPYQPDDDREDIDPNDHCLVRGGAYYNKSEAAARCSSRNLSHRLDRNGNRGFRLAASPLTLNSEPSELWYSEIFKQAFGEK
jgi:formylglycine-generating enzyme required for sulfatase activity